MKTNVQSRVLGLMAVLLLTTSSMFGCSDSNNGNTDSGANDSKVSDSTTSADTSNNDSTSGDTMDAEAAQLAITHEAISSLLAASMPSYSMMIETVLVPQAGPLGKVDSVSDDLIAALETKLKANLSGASCTVDVSRVDADTYKVTFTSCGLGTTEKATIEGAIIVGIDVKIINKEATVTVTFENFVVSGRKIAGTLKGTATAEVVKKTVTFDYQSEGKLTITAKDETQTQVALSGTVLFDIETQVAKINGTGTAEYNSKTYNFTNSDIVVKISDGVPSSGSTKIVYTNKVKKETTVEIIYSEQTVTDGKVEVKLNGKSQGNLTVDELITLLKSLS